MEGLLSEFCRPLAHAQNALPRWDIFVYPSQRQARGTSVDIENSVALRATPVKARSKREAIVIDKTVIAPTPRWDAISNGREISGVSLRAMTARNAATALPVDRMTQPSSRYGRGLRYRYLRRQPDE
jgi:hypothetical protein